MRPAISARSKGNHGSLTTKSPGGWLAIGLPLLFFHSIFYNQAYSQDEDKYQLCLPTTTHEDIHYVGGVVGRSYT